MIASLSGATAVCIVTEPTVSGLHDMERVIRLAAHFKVPGMVVVNKYDLNPDMSKAIEDLATERNVTVLGRIPFDPVFTKAMIKGQTVLEYDAQSDVSTSVRTIWNSIMNSQAMNRQGIMDLRQVIQ